MRVSQKFLYLTILLSLFSSLLFAAPFSPTLLRVTAPGTIQYDFDGSSLEIPITVSGTSANTIFLVYTKDKASSIGEVRNGFLGWHYVNKIDTCVFVSSMTALATGTSVIKWDGKDADGGMVLSGEYTYYLWAYDNIGTGEQMSNHPEIDFRNTGNMGIIQEIGEDGLPLTEPVFYSGIRVIDGKRTIHKWVIGTDPAEVDMVETTSFSMLTGWTFGAGNLALKPDDHSVFFWEIGNQELSIQAVEKRTWVPNGESQIVGEWAEDGMSTFSGYYAGIDEPGVVSDGGNYLFTGDGSRNDSSEARSDFYMLDINDGTILKHFDLTDWWSSPEDFENGGQMNGGPDSGFVMRGNYLFLSGGDSCIKQMVDPYAETEEGFYKWSNTNGDYTFDWNFEADAERPWVCIDFMVAPYVFNWAVDANGFSMGSAYDLGAVTWGLLAPDGTGLGYISVVGETAAWKWGAIYCDYGSAYDGIYKDPSNNDWTVAGAHPILFLGHDSIKGVITSSPVSVDEDAPVSFAVAQNSPNPFNPTTTITYSITEASHVTIDIFNVAGQKIDTIANEFMNAGNHSVTWNGNEFSAGMYFYTVKVGEFSKTVKMTLLK